MWLSKRRHVPTCQKLDRDTIFVDIFLNLTRFIGGRLLV